MSAYQFAGAAAALGGAAMVAMTFMQSNPEAEAKMPEEVKRNPLKKTLSNAGLYPQPDAAGSKMKRTASGSMAVFTSGEPGAALTKGGGDPM